jgi:hypothetical protein
MTSAGTWRHRTTVGAVLWATFAFLEPVTARAETILVAQNHAIRGSQSLIVPFSIATSGSATFYLADLDWTARLQNLTFSLFSATGALPAAQETGAGGGLVFALTAPGSYYAYVSATAGGRYSLGAVSLRGMFTPSTPPVPLPSALVLLLSGVGGVGGVAALMRRSRRIT